MVVTTEFLLNNYIQKEIVNVLRPLLVIEKLIFSSKFQLNYNFVTSNNKVYIGISLVAKIVQGIFTVLLTNLNLFAYFSVALMLVLAFFTTLTELTIVFLSAVLNSDNIIQMTFMIQEINDKLQPNDEKIWRKCKTLVWTLFFAIFTFLVVFTFSSMNLNFKSILEVIFFISSRILIDINIIYSIFFVAYLAKSLDIWFKKIASLVDSTRPQKGLSFYHQQVIEVKSLLETYKLIIRVSNLVQNVFGLSIAAYCMDIFLLFLVYVEAVILIFNISEATQSVDLVSQKYLPWMLKFFIVILILCRKCKLLDSKVNTAKMLCSKVLRNEQDVHIRRMCKNVVRVTDAQYSKLSACGVFTVDASLPLRLCALLATYTVVLLQFALS